MLQQCNYTPYIMYILCVRYTGASGGGCQWQAGGGGSPPLHGTLGTAQTCSAAVTARGMVSCSTFFQMCVCSLVYIAVIEQ